MNLRWLNTRIVFLEMTRGTRASNPPGTCVSRAIQRTDVRENAHGIVISDLVRGFQAISRTVQVFLSATNLSIQMRDGLRGHVCALEK